MGQGGDHNSSKTHREERKRLWNLGRMRNLGRVVRLGVGKRKIRSCSLKNGLGKTKKGQDRWGMRDGRANGGRRVDKEIRPDVTLRWGRTGRGTGIVQVKEQPECCHPFS